MSRPCHNISFLLRIMEFVNECRFPGHVFSKGKFGNLDDVKAGNMRILVNGCLFSRVTEKIEQ